MASNTEVEMRWINIWNDVYDIVKGREDISCMLPDFSIVGLKECLGWIQDAIYQGQTVRVEEGWVGDRRGVLVHRQDQNTE